jgi:metallo-beta-lactamase family protein
MPNKTPRVFFASGAGTVTGSNFILETASGDRVMIDCGLVQGEKVALPINHEPFPYEVGSVRALIITHAHLDHVGRIPKLVKEGFDGSIYSTQQTRELAELVLTDAVNIIAEEARREGIDPIYVTEDVPRAFANWKTVNYHEQFEPIPGMSAMLKDAGHILGSSMIEITTPGGDGSPQKIVFTGDLGNSPAPLLRDTEPLGETDYLIMESTYGKDNHEPKEARLAKFEAVIKSTLEQGGTLIIPAFSIDRTQVLLYELNNLIESGRLPRVPVLVDSPMGIKATQIYKQSESLFNDKARAQISGGDDIFNFPGVDYTETQNDSLAIDHLKGAKIIMAGSGMSVGGRILRHEEHFLPDPKNTLLLVGYQGVGSLGRALAEGAKKIHVGGREIAVRARVETLYGYSAHKDSDHLVEFVATATERLKQVFLVHGEPASSMYLAQRLNDELDAHAMMPRTGQWYELK